MTLPLPKRQRLELLEKALVHWEYELKEAMQHAESTRQHAESIRQEILEIKNFKRTDPQ